MDKVVVPGESLSAENKAATCRFKGTEFVGTFWRGEGGEAGERFEEWMGDVEVVQRKMGGEGVECVDVDGEVVRGVRAEEGECECLYSSLETE